jgi:hypothetical protein
MSRTFPVTSPGCTSPMSRPLVSPSPSVPSPISRQLVSDVPEAPSPGSRSPFVRPPSHPSPGCTLPICPVQPYALIFLHRFRPTRSALPFASSASSHTTLSLSHSRSPPPTFPLHSPPLAPSTFHNLSPPLVPVSRPLHPSRWEGGVGTLGPLHELGTDGRWRLSTISQIAHFAARGCLTACRTGCLFACLTDSALW